MTYVIGCVILLSAFSFVVLFCFDGWFPPEWSPINRPLGLLSSSPNLLFPTLLSICFLKMSNPQLVASSSNSTRRPRICSEGYIPRWENPSPVPQLSQDPVVVEKVLSTFTMERGVTRVNTHLVSSINVDHMLSKVLMGKMFGQPLDARLNKWKLGLSWKNEVKNTFYLDHCGRKWFPLEFTDEDDLKFVLNNRSWYVRVQIFHLEQWTKNFKDTVIITKLVVWSRIPRVPVQYKEDKIIKVATAI